MDDRWDDKGIFEKEIIVENTASTEDNDEVLLAQYALYLAQIEAEVTSESSESILGKIGAKLGEWEENLDTALFEEFGDKYEKSKKVFHIIMEKGPGFALEVLALTPVRGYSRLLFSDDKLIENEIIDFITKYSTANERKALAYITTVAGGGAGAFSKLKNLLHNDKIHLLLHEGGAHSGHSLAKHAVKTDAELLANFERQIKANPNNLKAASSAYTDVKTANDVVNKIYKVRKKDIDSWFKDPKDNPTKRFDLELNEVIGRGISKDRPIVSDWTKGRLVLFKDASSKKPKIITTYPVDKLKD